MCTVKMVNNKVVENLISFPESPGSLDLGVDLSPSGSIKDRTVVGTSDKIERMPLT